MKFISKSVALIALTLMGNAYVLADGPTSFHFANPGEWMHLKVTPKAGDERPIYSLWEAILLANNLYLIAVPTKSGNKSVRHVAYNPATKSRLKYHILYDLDHSLMVQFEEYSTLSVMKKLDINIPEAMFDKVEIDFSPPAYCLKGISQEEFKSLDPTAKKGAFISKLCDGASYLQ
jgi:hypothetical protein